MAIYCVMSASQGTVLIVDDQPETGHLLTRIMRTLGHHGVHVANGHDALDYVQQNLPDVVLLDYMMPDLDGLAVLRSMRSDPRTKSLPVVLYTASNDPKVMEAALSAGATEYWVKAGMGLSEMETRLQQWLPN